MTLCTCGSDNGGTVTAYTLLHQPHINFRPASFETKSLDTALSDLDTVIERSQYLPNYLNRGKCFAILLSSSIAQQLRLSDQPSQRLEH